MGGRGLCVLLLATLNIHGTSRADLQLANDGRTSYEIVKPAASTPVDEYAWTTLADFLQRKTGTMFPVVSAKSLSAGKKHIFVGLSDPVLKIAGPTPLDRLKNQEFVVRSAGDDVVLYGNGIHGNLDAVLDFMETTLGRRWYTESEFVETPQWDRKDGQPVFTVERSLNVKPFERKGGFSFAYRIPAYPKAFHYQHGLNMGFNDGNRDNRFPPGVVSLRYMPVGCHTLFGYVPPKPEDQAWPKIFGWLKKRDYFKTNPEFFTLDKQGKRVVGQLCFSNPALREELTKNILEHIRILKAQGKERLLIDVSANDDVGEFCYCPGCQALQKKHQSPGGPLYDYLFDLCAVVKKQHPDTMIHTLAYRLSQTQKPPVMPDGQSFPDNLIVQFASIHDNSDTDWNSPANRSSHDDLLTWAKLTPHLWTWYYPFPPTMPCGNIERLVADLRLMKKAGVEGVFYEFTSSDNWCGDNFTELQKYIFAKLLKDIDRDVPALIKEFTDYQYGPAATLVRTYLLELEEAQQAASHDTSLGSGRGYRRQLTVPAEALRRWQGYFDRMVSDSAADPRCLKNVRRLRRTLDLAALARWSDLSKAYPDYFSDYLVFKKRLGVLPRFYVAMAADWEMMIKVAGIAKPLPVQFDGIDKSLIRRLVPTRNRGSPRKLMDPDAAFGYAAVVNLPDKPFTFGFYQNDARAAGPKSTLNTSDIQPGGYRLYRLGEIKVTPDCIVWFSRSWLTNLQLGDRLYSPPSPDNDNRYDVYVSLKFDKPILPTAAEVAENNKWTLGTNDPYSVLCDQIIFVRRNTKQ